MLKILRLCLLLLLIICACENKRTTKSNRRVFIEHQNDKFILKKDGKPFIIKGVAGYSNLKALKEAGGNTIRTWDTTHLDSILQQAKIYDLAVVVGLPMPSNDDVKFFYDDTAKVSAQYRSYYKLVNQYKNHPSLLFWCLGNELAFPIKPQYNSFYRTFNHLVEMIHKVDTNHLVTTTMVNFQPKKIFNIRFRTDIDFLSFNIFGRMKYLNKELEDYKWLWDGPFLITEWGIDGPWDDADKTVWGSYIESTSSKKSEQYFSIYQHFMPLNNPRFLGSMVFYWGQKQEYTPTWFSLFAENGDASETVGTMQKIWTGKDVKVKAPQIKYMLVDKKGAKDNILFVPNKNIEAQVFLENTDNKNLTFSWEILPEDWLRIGDTFGSKRPKTVQNLFIEQHENHYIFRTPTKEGAYRIYVNVSDQHGLFASANTPFYVVEK